ncbi:MAG: TRAP transporter large permease [Proteobacteria bacterium]|nr:TRAP transporter large permease [Pseudomonadota bacterium]MBU1060499.1 TRAP transporter large permease [Pseudomonadota bacterium]
MDLVTIAIIGIAVLVVLLILGVHIGVALGMVGIVGMVSIVGFEASMKSATDTIYHKLSSFELITIPLFILMGYLASSGGISSSVFEALNRWVGRIKGGIGIATVASCTAFGAVTGSSLVTSSVFASICAPEMRKYGYDKKLAYGICASGGMIGMLIPPSILMIIYGVLSGESTGRLLIAGIAPGLLLMILFAVTIRLLAHFMPDMLCHDRSAPHYTLGEKITSLARCWQIWFVALIMFGGIFGGIFNPTEAAAVASSFLFFLLVVTKFNKILPLLREAFWKTASTTCMIFLVMGGAAIFSHFLVLTGMTQDLADYIIGMQLSPLGLIITLSIFYILLGCFLDSISMLCITIPIFNPIISAYAMDPIWYAVVVVMSIEAGLITPPVGLNVYGAYAVAEKDVSLEDIFSGVWPFLVAVWLSIVILILFPSISTVLPNLMLGK